MSRKKKNQRSAKKNAPANTQRAQTPAELMGRADSAMAAGNYREAIQCFREFGKLNPEIMLPGEALHDLLLDAYAKRAQQLESKGMLKEALAIWDNRQGEAATVPVAIEHIDVALRLGKIERALALYQQLQAAQATTLTPEKLKQLQGLLAAAYLAWGGKGFDVLAPEDALIQHGTLMLAAVQAYCEGQDAEATESLKQIPFRSPYRDMVTVLRALLRLESEPVEAERLLKRIPDDSPFQSLAESVSLARQPEADCLQQLATAQPSQRDVVLRLRGWSKQRQALWREINPAWQPQVAPEDLFGQINRHKKELPERWYQRARLRLMHALGYDRITPSIRRTLTLQERLLLEAWKDQANGYPMDTASGWVKIAELIERESPNLQPGSEAALRVAVLYRAAAEFFVDVPERFRDWDEHHGPAALMQNSIDLDPDYQPIRIALIKLLMEQNRTTAAREATESALQQGPRTVELLSVAMDLAFKTRAFKKASGYAQQILELDPINRRARDRLFLAHIKHARRQHKARKPHIVERELEAAATYADRPQTKVRLNLIRTLIAHDPKDKEAYRPVLSDLDSQGAPFYATVALSMEAEALGLKPKALLQKLDLYPLLSPKLRDLKQGISLLQEWADPDQRDAPEQTVGLIEPILKKMSKLRLERDDRIWLCERLKGLGAHALSQAFAKEGLKQQGRDDPLWTFYDLEAEFILNKRALGSPIHAYRVGQAIEQAKSQGDQRAAERLIVLLQRIEEAMEAERPRHFWEDDPWDDDDDDDDDDIRSIFNALGGGPPQDRDMDSQELVFIERILKAVVQSVPEKDVESFMNYTIANPSEMEIIAEAIVDNNARRIPKAVLNRFYADKKKR